MDYGVVSTPIVIRTRNLRLRSSLSQRQTLTVYDLTVSIFSRFSALLQGISTDLVRLETAGGCAAICLTRGRAQLFQLENPNYLLSSRVASVRRAFCLVHPEYCTAPVLFVKWGRAVQSALVRFDALRDFRISECFQHRALESVRRLRGSIPIWRTEKCVRVKTRWSGRCPPCQ